MVKHFTPIAIAFLLTAAGCDEQSHRPNPTTMVGPESVAPNADLEKATTVVKEWLTDLKNGGDGKTYWTGFPSNHGEPRYTRIPAVRSFELQRVLKDEPNQEERDVQWLDAALVSVRIDHSDAAGHQVTKEWAVRLVGQRGFWRIVAAAQR